MSAAGGSPKQKAVVDTSAAAQAQQTAARPVDQPRQPSDITNAGQQTDQQNTTKLKANVEVAPGVEKSMDVGWWGVGVEGVGVLLSFVSIVLVYCALRQSNKSLRLAMKERATATRRAIEQSDETAQALLYAEASAVAMGRVADTAIENARYVRESVDQQRMLGRIQTRPFLSVQIGTAEWQDATHNFAAYPILHNTGQTPARNIQYRIVAQVLPSTIFPEFKFWLPEKTGGSNIIGPNQTGTMMAVVPWRVPDEWVIPVKLGLHFSLYVWGTVSYGDNFGTRHRATFAQQIFWRRTGFMGEDGFIPERVEGVFLGRHNQSS